jgi:hypothetical protein
MTERSKSFLLKSGLAVSCGETAAGNPTITSFAEAGTGRAINTELVDVTETPNGSTQIHKVTQVGPTGGSDAGSIFQTDATQSPSGAVSRVDETGHLVVNDSRSLTVVEIANNLKEICNQKNPNG